VTDNILLAGCPGVCSKVVTVNPNPTCAISGQTPVPCNQRTNVYTSTVTPAGGTVTHSWSITGSGTILGSTTGASVTVVAGGSGSFTLTDVITRDGCPGQCSVTVPITACPPQICVTKEIACLIGTNQCGTFGESATGYKVVSATGTNLPAFCYRITVRNCGPIGLTNVTVMDDKFGDLTAHFRPCVADVFPPNAVCSYTFTTSLESDLINTVNASGRSVATGQLTNALDSATGHVFQASIECNELVTSPDDVDNNPNDNHVTLLDVGTSHNVTYKLTVTNSGAANLANVTLSDPPLASLGCVLPPPFSLAAHTSFNFTCTVAINCTNLPTGGLADATIVNATVDTTLGACGVDTNGRPIQVRSEGQCNGLVVCTNPCILSVTKTACIITPPAPCNPLTTCTPPYPFASTNPLTSIVFNESEVLRAFTATVTNDCNARQIRVWYNDEHALTLGIRRVLVKPPAASVTNDYQLTAMTSPTQPDSAVDPLIGTTAQTGDQAGTDLAGRPIAPA